LGTRGRRSWRAAALCAAALGLGGSAGAETEPPGFDRTVYAMGTRLGLHLGGHSEAVLGASEGAVREVERIEAACSTWRPDSAWSQLNAAGGQPVPLAPEWIRLLQDALSWQRRTDGAFDPVLGALLQAWGIREGGHTPDPATLAAARTASGGGLLNLDDAHHTAQLRHPQAAVEEGGFVKGYALDRALAVLRAQGVPSGWLDFGGQLLVWGQPLRVEVADPVDRQQSRFAFTLSSGSISTSGTSEHGRHILNPQTGAPCPAWGSVSVVAADGLSADILSLALYVMGPERGPVWADRNGVAALFQVSGGAALMSRAFQALHAEDLSARGQVRP
jgi:thiamine biosynthesis lipoprotein